MASVVPSAVVTPSPPDLLAAWESGQEAGIVQRGAALLAAALPGQPSDALAAMTPGERDVRLLQVHRALFGPRLECVMNCEECSHDLELTLAVADLLACAAEGHPAAADEHGAGNPAELVSGGWRVSFRLLELADLAEAASAAGPVQARRMLLRRCVVHTIDPEGRATPGLPEEGLPPEVERALVEQLERRDVLGALDLQLVCPECSHVWMAPFDILSFLWAEIDDWARRTLREIHVLAATYGWGEGQILSLSPWRRQAYLQMCGHA